MKTFIFGGDDLPRTPQELARLRATAEALAPSRAPQNVGEGIASIGNALVYRALMGKADKAQKAGTEAASKRYDSVFKALIGGGGSAAPSAAGAPSPASTSLAPVDGSAENARAADRGSMPGYAGFDLKGGIQQSAAALGIDPVDLATAISYETAGTFDPVKAGPTTQWGQHKGLIQFGEPQAKEYGVDWNNPLGSQLGADGAVVKYLKQAGVQPGMGMMDIYSAINAGRVGRYNASDANNGGAPGTVADKVNTQMDGHRQKALALFADQAQQASPFNAQPGMAATASPALGYAPQQPVEVASLSPEMPDMSLRRGGDAPPAAAAGMGQQNAIRALAGIPVNSEGGQAQSPATQVAQAAPMGSGFDINAAIELANDPYLPEGRKAVLQALIGQQLEQQQAQREMEMKRSDPAYQLDLQTKQAQLEKLRNPAPPAKPTDVQEYEYAKSQGYDGSFLDFQLAQKKAGASQVNIDQKTEGEFDKELAKKQAVTLDTMATEGMNARAELGVIDQLDGLLAGQGGTLTGMSGMLARYGIGGENVSDLQAADALINKLIPSQRAPGSGSMSDRDVEMFKASLPSLWNTPGGNQLILGTMRGLAQYKQAQGDIAQRVMIGEIDRKEAIKMLRELPNPLEEFRKMKPAAKTETPQQKQPVVIDGYQIEEVQ